MKRLNALFAGKAPSELGVRILPLGENFPAVPARRSVPGFSNAAPTWPGRSAGFLPQTPA